MDPSTLDVKHDPKVYCYTAQNSKAVDKGPIGGVQGDLTGERYTTHAVRTHTLWATPLTE